MDRAVSRLRIFSLADQNFDRTQSRRSLGHQSGAARHAHLTTGETTLEVPARTPFVVSLADEMVSERGPDERLQLYLARDRFRDLAPVLDAGRGDAVTGSLETLLADYLELLDRSLRQIDIASACPLRDAVGA